jgi:alpha-tubulin suppressor-like RCC1 family protein
MASILTNAFKLNQMYELLVDECVDCFSATPGVGELWVWGAQQEGGVLGLNCADNLSDPKSQVFYSSLPSNLPGSKWYVCSVGRVGSGSIAASYAVKCDGTLWAWGSNCFGQLGQNNTIHRSSPNQIPGTQWKCVASTDGAFVLALKNDNTLWVWGCNTSGQLGQNDTNHRSSPIQVPGCWCDVAGGFGSSYGVKVDGTLFSWGNGVCGLLGNNCDVLFSSPIQIPGTQWSRVFSQCFSVAAIKCDGTLWSWGGQNDRGQLGQNNTILYSSPTQIPGTQWKCVATAGHTLALKTDGTLWAWGRGQYGAIGNLSTANCEASSPIQIPGTQWRDIAVSSPTTNRSYALKNDGSLWYWGYQTNCAFGTQSLTHQSSPIQLIGRQWTDILSLDCGAFGIENNFTTNSFDITRESAFNENCCGRLFIWGDNNSGQLGNSGNAIPIGGTASSPIQIPGTWWKYSRGTDTVHAIRSDCTLWGWGRNRRGIIGDNSIISRCSPVQIPGTAWCAVSTGGSDLESTAALKVDNTLWMWGNGECGVLGLGDVIHRSSPVQIPGTQWCCVSAGTLMTYAIKTDGTLWAWGQSTNGELAQNNRTSYSSPVQIPGTQWSAVNRRNTGAIALKSDGTLWTWGQNSVGQIGDNTTTNRSSPVQVPGTQWCRIAAGDSTVYAFKTDGTLWGWGENTVVFALGLGDSVNYSSPVQIPGTQWYRIEPRYRGVNILKKNGEIWGWGLINSGNFSTQGGSCPCSGFTYVCQPFKMTGITFAGMKFGTSSNCFNTGGAIITPTLPF